MPSWLVDDPSVVYLVLAIAALGLGIVWWQTRRRQCLYGLGIVAGLCAIVMLLSYFVETDAKRIKRKLMEMAGAVETHEIDRLFSHVSDQFRIQNTDKAAFRELAKKYVTSAEVARVLVWDIDVKESSRQNRTAKVFFKAKGFGSAFVEGSFYNCRARFVLDPDGEWRLQSFELFPPQTDPNSSQSIRLPF